jgi:hypothetical protein
MSKGLPIQKETLLSAQDERQRDSLFYDLLEGIYNKICEQQEKCEERICNMEKDIQDKASQTEFVELATRFDRRKKVDTSLGIASGFIGGVVGFFLKAFAFK